MPEDVHSRLGAVESSIKHIDHRLDTLEQKTERKLDDVLQRSTANAHTLEHIKNNVKMMRGPVEDYQRLKHQGTGMWMLITFILGAATTIFNIASYIIRVYVMKIGD